MPITKTRGHGMTAISSHNLLVVRIRFGSLHHSFHSETVDSNHFAATKRYRVRVVAIKRNSLTSSTLYNSPNAIFKNAIFSPYIAVFAK